tara:strand:- start:2848 stop:3405 length:558 start_codon:yes stop_codon:yes gene_type:complete
MARKTFVTPEPVVLEGYQAVMQPSKFGYSLKAIVDHDMIIKLEDDRTDLIKWCESKLKNPKRSVQKPEPWEEVSEGKYTIKFSWNEENKPPVVDTEGTPVTDTRTPVYSGSQVKLAFYQKPYVLRDQTTYGTSLKLVGVQVVTCNGQAGVDTGDMAPEDVAEMFGKTQGFKTDDPNVTTHDEDDF